MILGISIVCSRYNTVHEFLGSCRPLDSHIINIMVSALLQSVAGFQSELNAVMIGAGTAGGMKSVILQFLKLLRRTRKL